MFCLNSDVHTYNTRQRHSFHYDKWKLDIMRRTIRIQVVIIWNKVAELIDTDCSPAVFKHKIKYLLSSKLI